MNSGRRLVLTRLATASSFASSTPKSPMTANRTDCPAAPAVRRQNAADNINGKEVTATLQPKRDHLCVKFRLSAFPNKTRERRSGRAVQQFALCMKRFLTVANCHLHPATEITTSGN